MIGNKSTGLAYENGNEITLSDKVRFITGDIGEIVYECGAFGVALDSIDYEKIQQIMDSYPHCCGNNFHGCENYNFISLWELYWNFNCEEDVLFVLEQIKDGAE